MIQFNPDAVAEQKGPCVTSLETSENELRIGDEVVSILRCPNCLKQMDDYENGDRFVCGHCESSYPVSNGVPILVVPSKSLFDIETFTNAEPTFFRPVSRLRGIASSLLPKDIANVSAKHVYPKLLQRVLELNHKPTILVVGGGVVGGGMECLIDNPNITLIETDAAIAPRTSLICDGHDLPFADQSMDAVIVQAVLEHVCDPHRCVKEIHRVLKPNGIVYSDTPFMQQVHGRQFDFTRFTRLGHRRLFRMFDEIESGISCGPGAALAWSIRYFMLSFFSSQYLRSVVSAVARLAIFPLKYFDYYLVNSAPACDAASSFYFLGTKSAKALSDRELIDAYRGGF